MLSSRASWGQQEHETGGGARAPPPRRAGAAQTGGRRRGRRAEDHVLAAGEARAMGRSMGGCLAVAGHRHQWYIGQVPESNGKIVEHWGHADDPTGYLRKSRCS